MNFTPFVYAANRVLGRTKDIAQLASRTWTLEAEARERVPSALYLPDALDRVTGLGPFTTMADQRGIIAGGEVTHLPVRMHEVRRATLLDGSLYLTRHRSALRENTARFSRQQWNIQRRSEGALCSTYFGGLYFGHWMTDDLPLTLLAGEHGTAVAVPLGPSVHRDEYQRRSGAKSQAIEAAEFDRLLVFEDRAQTRSKIGRYLQIRQGLLASVQSQPEHPGVFLLRGTSGARRLLENESTLADWCRSQGMKVVDPMTLSVGELIAATAGAQRVVGVEGSHLLHAMYTAAPCASFTVLLPPNRFSNVIKYWTDALSMGYAFVVGRPGKQDTFSVDLDDLKRTLGLFEGRAGC